MKRRLMPLTTIKTKAILATLVMIFTICASVQRTTAGQPSATTNPFAGKYCGYLESRNYGSMSISESGNVSGYFNYLFMNYYESFTLSGRITAAGVMRLKVVRSITVRDRGVRTRTERYSVTVNVTLDESGNLVGTSGASFMLSPCH